MHHAQRGLTDSDHRIVSNIHPTAIVEAGARIDPSVTVGPYAVIGAQVVIGPGSSVGPHCVIQGRTTIGKDNRIFQFASLGADPQDKKYRGEDTELVIGDRNTVREFCTFNRGVPGAGGKTSIGDDNWIMAYTHIAHDCHVGNHTTMANNTTLAGHVLIGDWVTVNSDTRVNTSTLAASEAMAARCQLASSST